MSSGLLRLPQVAVPAAACKTTEVLGGCDHVGIFTPASQFLALTTQSTFSQQTTVPNQASLEGFRIHLQMWWFSPTAIPQFQASNGVLGVLGVLGR